MSVVHSEAGSSRRKYGISLSSFRWIPLLNIRFTSTVTLFLFGGEYCRLKLKYIQSTFLDTKISELDQVRFRTFLLWMFCHNILLFFLFFWLTIHSFCQRMVGGGYCPSLSGCRVVGAVCSVWRTEFCPNQKFPPLPLSSHLKEGKGLDFSNIFPTKACAHYSPFQA